MRIVILAILLSASARCFAADSGKDSTAQAQIDTVHHTGPIAQSYDYRRAEPGLFDFITNLPSDWYDYTVHNVRAQYWPQIALVTASTAAMIVYDHQMWEPFAKQYAKGGVYKTWSDLFVDIGDGKFQFGLAGLFAGYGAISGDKRSLRTASQVCEVILAGGAVVQLLKHVTGRESPIDMSTPTGRWQWLPNQIDYLHHTSHYDAFPSGHLTTALATLTVIANNYPEYTWIRPVGYAACAGLAVGLVSQSIHWWSDYPLAIAFGIGFGNLVSPNPQGDVSVIDPTSKKDMGAVTSTLSKLLAQASFAPAFTRDGGSGVSMILRF